MVASNLQTERENLSDLIFSEANGNNSREEFTILEAERHLLTLGDVVQVSSGATPDEIVKAQLSGGTTKGVCISRVPLGLVAATQFLDIATNPTATDTVVVGGQTYTFVADAGGGSEDDVDIGSDAEGSVDNLIAAINNTVGSAVEWHASTAKNAKVHAVKISATRMQVIAIVPGSAGNAIVCTETFTDTDDAWVAATLLGGKGVVPTKCVVLVRNCVVKKETLNYGGEAVATVDAALKVLGIDPRSVPATLATQTT